MPNLVPNCGEDLFLTLLDFGDKKSSIFGEDFFFAFGLHSISGRKDIFFTNVLSHSECVCSRLQKCPPCKILQFKYCLQLCRGKGSNSLEARI